VSVVGGLLYCPGNFLAAETTLLKKQVHNHNYTVSKDLANNLTGTNAIVVNSKAFFYPTVYIYENYLGVQIPLLSYKLFCYTVNTIVLMGCELAVL